MQMDTIKAMLMQEDDFDNYFSKGNNYVTVDANLSYAFEMEQNFYTGVSNLFDKKICKCVTSTRSTFGAGPRKVYYQLMEKCVCRN